MMTLEEADKVFQVWATYLEYVQGKLNFIFGPRIPESFLPFPSKTIEEAIHVVAQHYRTQGNQEVVPLIQSGLGWLTGYTDDATALLQAAKLFNDPKWREAILPAFKKFHEDWTAQHTASGSR